MVAAVSVVVLSCAAAAGCAGQDEEPSGGGVPKTPASSQTFHEPQAGNFQAVRDPDDPNQPAPHTVPMQDAAKIGADSITKLYGDNLSGKPVNMTYVPAQNHFEQPAWNGWIADERHRGSNKSAETETHYSFSVNAKTGVLERSCRVRQFVQSGSSVPTEDPAITQDSREYQALAKRFAEQHHLLSGDIQSVEYFSQGKAGNDPVVSLTVQSASGEHIRLEISRLDKTLAGYYANL